MFIIQNDASVFERKKAASNKHTFWFDTSKNKIHYSER